MTAANARNLVEPHAVALEACADAMSAAGIGCAHTGGYVTHLRCMAGSMRASAARGEIPSAYTSTMIGAKETDMPADTDDKTLKAIQAAMNSVECKATAHYFRKHGLTIEKIETVGEFDARLRARALPIPLHERLAMKSALLRAGLLV
jgi:hypothetical protein